MDSHDVLGRRSLLGGGVALVGAAAIAAPAMAQTPPASAYDRQYSDADLLNFALNLEYLEAEYYLRGINGEGLDQAVGQSLGAPVRGGHQVSFANPLHRQFLADVARNELAHVQFLRSALDGNAVMRPPIDFHSGFAAVAQGARLGSGFDPFANEFNFFLGAMLFEDVGVTAYKGAAPLLRNKDYLQAAAGIEAVEAYHAGMVRAVLFKMGRRAQEEADAISALRDALDGPQRRDEGILVDGRVNIVPADANGVAFSRTPQQVLNIVYARAGSGAARGGFFPQGTNGRINAT